MPDRHALAQYDRLRAAILDGSFPPGHVLSPTTLGVEAGVSRTPVREALGRLAQEGFVEQVARGYRVRIASPDELLDVFDARIALESSAARLAAQRRTDDDLAQLEHLTEALDAETDPTAQHGLNTLWHHAVVDAAHNTTIAEMVENTRSRLAIHRRLIASRRTAESAVTERVEHRGILDAIREGDAGRAHALMAMHLAHGRDMRVGDAARSDG